MIPRRLLGDVSRETEKRLSAFVEHLLAENKRQNLIARSTETDIWHRHIQDSWQLLPLSREGVWLDIGTGAGLPGLVAAIARPNQETVLVEPRARRVDFLCRVVDALDLKNVCVMQARVEAVDRIAAATISARAVASLDLLFAGAGRHAGPETVWLLPKGQRATEELAAARARWQGEFRLVPSITEPEAAIVVAQRVRPAVGGRQ